MKSDINLLFKRRNNNFSARKLAATLIVIAVFAGSLYAGITLPSQALAQARVEVQDLDAKLETSTVTEEDLREKTRYSAFLQEQLDDLTTLSSTESDVSAYLKAIEDALPTSANITSLTVTDDNLNILGTALSDEIVATFCLMLKDCGMFENVFISTSTALSEDEITAFTLSAKLIEPLGSSAMIEPPEDFTAAQEEESK